MDVYTELHCICRKLVEKVNYLDENEQKELRSEVGNQASPAKMGERQAKESNAKEKSGSGR